MAIGAGGGWRAAVVACAFVSGVAGCGGDDAVAPAITADEAAAVLRAHQQVSGSAATRSDPAKLADVESGAMLEIDAMAVQAGQTPEAKGGAVTAASEAEFWIARQSGYPRYFLAVGQSDAEGEARELSLFARERPGEPWKLVAAPRLPDGGLPAPLLDDAGYTELAALPAGGNAGGSGPGAAAERPALAVDPAKLAAAHAGYLNEPSGEASMLFAGGPHTSETVENDARIRSALRKLSTGLTYRAVKQYRGPAFRTADGGALVFYALERIFTAAATKTHHVGRVPEDVAALLDSPAPWGSVEETRVSQYATYVPPEDTGQVHVLASRSGLVSAGAAVVPTATPTATPGGSAGNAEAGGHQAGDDEDRDGG